MKIIKHKKNLPILLMRSLLVSAMMGGINLSVAQADQPKPVGQQPIIGQYVAGLMASDKVWHERIRPDTPFNELNRLYIAFGKIVENTDGHFTIQWDTSNSSALRPIELMRRLKAMNPNA